MTRQDLRFSPGITYASKTNIRHVFLLERQLIGQRLL